MSTDFALFGRDLFGDPIEPRGRGLLAKRFEFPPFSVLNAREGEWQERKAAWLSIGIQSECGRSTSLLKFSDAVARMKYSAEKPGKGSSIFDPVLCELAYRWFCPEGGLVLDPFAGGSVRGIVAGMLGYSYHGIELRQEQVAANEQQREAIAPDKPIAWRCGDSRLLLGDAPMADFLFSCPPYGDLERYSDDPSDLSTMEYPAFVAAYREVITAAALRLKDNRFACFVVGDFRCKRSGLYRGFVADTIAAFRAAGLGLYNDAVLITAIGSLPIRISWQFDASRKLGKTHQNVLVFAKGDPRVAFAKTD